MPLTDTAVKAAKAAPKPYKLSDQDGLVLLVTPNGYKWWRLRYRFQGREKMLSLGVYPDVSLKEARARRDAARKIVTAGGDPSRVRQEERDARATTFEGVAREWQTTRYAAKAPKTNAKVLAHLERHLFPWLGARPVAAIEAPELLAALRRVESTSAIETAHRVMQAAAFAALTREQRAVPGERAHRAAGAGYHHGLPGLGSADIRDTEVRCHADLTEHRERGFRRQPGRERVHPLPVGQGIFDVNDRMRMIGGGRHGPRHRTCQLPCSVGRHPR